MSRNTNTIVSVQHWKILSMKGLIVGDNLSCGGEGNLMKEAFIFLVQF